MQLLFRGGKAIAYFGFIMILMGTLVFLFPKFFAYIFAGLVITLGLLFVGIGFAAKPMMPPGAGQNPRQADDGFSSYEEIRD